MITLEEYLDEQFSPWWNYIIGIPGMMTDGVRSLLGYEETTIDKESCGTIELTKKRVKTQRFEEEYLGDNG